MKWWKRNRKWVWTVLGALVLAVAFVMVYGRVTEGSWTAALDLLLSPLSPTTRGDSTAAEVARARAAIERAQNILDGA